MAAETYTAALTQTTNIWRKIQGKASEVVPVLNKEFRALEDFLPPEQTIYSARESLIPLDINDTYGAAMITPGDFEALPAMVDMDELTITMQQMNKRFTTPLMEQWGDKQEAQVTRLLKYKFKKSLRAVAREYANQFYGTSVGTVCLTDTDVSGTTATLTLKHAYGQTTITNIAFLASKFKIGERIALVDGSTLVTNGIGTVTAVTAATPSIGVTFQGSVTVTNNDLKIVKAHSQGNETLAHTNYNKAIVGLCDVLFTDSVHGKATTSVPDWSVAFADTTGGAFDGVRLRAGADELEEWDNEIDLIFVDKAVYRDWYRSERSILRHDDPMGMETDGDIKSGGRKFIKTRNCIPGFAIGVSKGAYLRWSLLPKPDGSGQWSDGIKVQDKSALAFSIDWPIANVCRDRKGFVYWTGLDRN